MEPGVLWSAIDQVMFPSIVQQESHLVRDRRFYSCDQLSCLNPLHLHEWRCAFSRVIVTSDVVAKDRSGMKVVQGVVDYRKAIWGGIGKRYRGVISCGDLC